MLRRIHINQHVIKRNAKTGETEPVITCKTYKENSYCHQVIINDHTKVIYSPNKPLSCGAKVWIETTEKVECITNG
tara:strand:- start:55 stop:282 length:228 start_codon:yes stop_codon:yes gene_type:complete